MAEAILLQHPWLVNYAYPFLLVFTIVFAVLQKSEILGKGKKQIDAIVGLVIGLIFIAFPGPRDLVINLMPFLAVGLVIILVFLLLWGFFWKEGEFDVHKNVKIAAGIVAFIAVVIAVAYFSGFWDSIYGIFSAGGSGGGILANIIFIVVIGAVIAAVLVGGKSNTAH